MKLSRTLFFSAAFMTFTLPSFAQDQDVAALLVAELRQLPYADCLALYHARLAVVPLRVPSKNPKSEALRLIAEGNRLACEATRLREVAAGMSWRREVLLVKADGLDLRWEADHAADPSGVIDYAGHDRSQTIMRDDAEGMAGSMADIADSAQNVLDTAEDVLRTSIEEFRLLSKPDHDAVVITVDAESQNDILLRLLGLSKPKPTANI